MSRERIARGARLVARRPLLVLALVGALALAAAALALRLEPSAATGTLVERGSGGYAATERFARNFGEEPVIVLVKGALPRTLLSSDLGRLLRLEGCLSGNVPRRALAAELAAFRRDRARGLPPACLELARLRPFKVVYGPATFVNTAAAAIADELGARRAASARRARRAADAARRLSARRGDPPPERERLARAARDAVLAELTRDTLRLALRYGLTGLPAIDNPDFVSTLVFDPRAARPGVPKSRFAYLFPSARAALVQARLRADLDEAGRRRAIELVRAAVGAPPMRLEHGGRYVVTGVPVVLEGVAGAIERSVLVLLGAALLVMAATLALVLRARLRLLPLALALAAAALTFGALSLAGGTLTMASIAVLPVLIGLAVDYAIQFQARFEERRARRPGERPADAGAAAAAGGPTIVAAGAATAAGLLVLLLSPLPIVRGFGALLVLGVVLAIACSLTAGLAALARFGGGAARRPPPGSARPADGGGGAPRRSASGAARALARLRGGAPPPVRQTPRSPARAGGLASSVTDIDAIRQAPGPSGTGPAGAPVDALADPARRPGAALADPARPPRAARTRPPGAALAALRERGADGAWRALGVALSHPGRVLAAALALAAVGWVAGMHARVESDLRELAPADLPALRDAGQLERETGVSGEIAVAVSADDVTRPAVVRWMARLERRVLREEGYRPGSRCADARAAPALCPAPSLPDLVGAVGAGGTPAALRARLARVPAYLSRAVLAPDRRSASIAFGIRLMPLERQRAVVDALRARLDPPPGVEAAVVGLPALAAEANGALASPARRWLSLLAALLGVFLVLLVARRSRREAIVPLVPIALASGWSSGLLFLLGLLPGPLEVALNPLSVTLGLLVIAITTEFSVLLSARYAEERAAGASPARSIELAYASTGAAVLASGATAIAGFAALAASDIRMLRDFGIATVVDLAVALVGVLLVLPAALLLAERHAPELRDLDPRPPARALREALRARRPRRRRPAARADAP